MVEIGRSSGSAEFTAAAAAHMGDWFGTLSKRHAEIMVHDDTVKVRDLGSTNGTFVNGARLAPHEWRDVRAGDVIRFGHRLAASVTPSPPHD